jgi:hypothetical protein
MRFRHESSVRERKPNESKKDNNKRRGSVGPAAAVAVGTFLAFSPLVGGGLAKADQPNEDGKAKVTQPAGEGTKRRTIVITDDDLKKPVTRKATSPDKPERKRTRADRDTKRDESKVPEPAATKAEEPEESNVRNAAYQAGDSLVDVSLASFDDTVDISGRPRRINLKHNLDLGGTVIVNESGSSIFASAWYKKDDLAKWFKMRVGLSAGNIWFGEQAAPFATLAFNPEINVWRLKFLYQGRISALGNMASVLYTSHTAGIGFSQPIKNWRLRLGVVGGGALSYPAFDDIYFNFSVGASAEWDKRLLLYAAPIFYFAAGNPMQTAYVGHYKPRFQDIDMGAQLRIAEYTARAFVRAGMLSETYGARATRTVNFAKNVSGDIWVGGGATRWAGDLGGRWDFVAMAGATFVIGGEWTNSTNKVRYEHLQAGGTREAKTDIPTKAEPGPYGFGRSGNPIYDTPINKAKNLMASSAGFNNFAQRYQNASQDEVITVTRWLGAFMQQVAYANDAYDAMTNTQLFDPEVIRISYANNDMMFGYLQRYVNFYENNAPNAKLSDDLKKGIAVCAGIHSLMADFLRANGMPALVASVNTRKGPHVIAIGQPSDKTILFDYGNTFTTPPGTFDQTLRFYGQHRGAPTFQSQLFNADGYLGTYRTPEGRLLHDTIGNSNQRILMKGLLGVH